MKLVKISIVALSMGLFLASCGGSTEETTPATDTVATEAPAVVEEVAAPVVDSAAVMVDTTAAAPAPAAH